MTQMVPTGRIDELVQRLQQAAGTNLQSVILYGSAASDDFDPEISDVNLLCILHQSSFAALQAVAPVINWWTRRRQPVPLFMTLQELERSTDVFAIEFLDMREQYRVLFGQDVLKDLQIPMPLHRVQVEYELREKLLLLRQRVLIAADHKRQLRKLLLESLPSVLTLFRHALIALGEAPLKKREAVQLLARRVGFDPTAISQAVDARDHKLDISNVDIKVLFAGYLDTIEQVATAVDKMLDQERASRPVP
jgi:hypothetical protein